MSFLNLKIYIIVEDKGDVRNKHQDMKLTEMHLLVHLELLVRQGAGKKSCRAFMKKKGPLPGEINYLGQEKKFLISFDPKIEIPFYAFLKGFRESVSDIVLGL